jgi:hypothetical protein
LAASKEEFLLRLVEQFGPSDLESERARIAGLLSVDPGEINIVKDVLTTKLSRGGVILSPHIRRTRFTVQLDAEDLGLKPDDPEHKEFLQHYTALGQKFLLDSEYLRRLDRIDRAMRRLVEKNGFQTAYGFFVPYGLFSEVKSDMKVLEDDYFKVRDEILDLYDTCRCHTEEAYRKAAAKAYQLLYLDASAVPPDEFVESFVRRVMDNFPSLERIRDSFAVELGVSYVPLTTFVQEQEARRRLIKKKEELLEEQLRLEEGEIAYQRRRFEDVNREAIVSYKRQMDDFISDVVGQTYAIIYEAVNTVRQHCAKNGSLGSGDVKRLKSMIAKVRKLNLFESKEIDQYIQDLEDVLGAGPKGRDRHDVFTVLQGISLDAKRVLNLLGCEPRVIRGGSSSSPSEDAEAGIEVEPVVTRRQRRLEEVPEQDGNTFEIVDVGARAARYAS